MELFRKASGDENPIHFSEYDTHRSPFGEPIVYGILAFLVAASKVTKKTFQKIDVRFQGPLYPDTDYYLIVNQIDSESARIQIKEGSKKLLQAQIEWTQGSEQWNGDEKEFVLKEPLTHTALSLKNAAASKESIKEEYGPQSDAFECLCEALGITPQPQIACLLWASALVGMRWPGERSVFSRLRAQFYEGGQNPSLAFQACLNDFDERFSRLEISAQCFRGIEKFSDLEIEAFLRPILVDESQCEPQIKGKPRLQGKNALVIGGSRGLGASLVRSLCREGCNVSFTYFQSESDAKKLIEELKNEVGTVRCRKCEAGNFEQTIQLRNEWFVDEKLDFLILNASPAPRRFFLDELGYKKISEAFRTGVEMSLVPLSCFLGELKPGGTILGISSHAVLEPVSEWPQYVAFKSAIEGFLKTAQLEYPEISVGIVRPSRLKTEMTNTPTGHQSASAPTQVAVQIVERLIESGLGIWEFDC